MRLVEFVTFINDKSCEKSLTGAWMLKEMPGYMNFSSVTGMSANVARHVSGNRQDGQRPGWYGH